MNMVTKPYHSQIKVLALILQSLNLSLIVLLGRDSCGDVVLKLEACWGETLAGGPLLLVLITNYKAAYCLASFLDATVMNHDGYLGDAYFHRSLLTLANIIFPHAAWVTRIMIIYFLL